MFVEWSRMFPWFTVYCVAAGWAVFRLATGYLNRSRIRTHIVQGGGSVIAISWAPFGSGAFSIVGPATYRVQYRDREKSIRRALCRTGALSGVFFANDTVIHRSPEAAASRNDAPASFRPSRFATLARGGMPEKTGEDSGNQRDVLFENQRLREENQMLREELERMQR